MHKRDTVRKFKHRRHVMADHHRRQIELLLRFSYQLVYLMRSRRVEPRGRFVKHQYFRPPNQRPRERRAFLHATAHLRRILALHPAQANRL